MYSRVYVEITNVCNKNCSFCPKTKRSPAFMSKEQFEIVTDKLKSLTNYIYLHVMGEPLLHPDVADFVEIATPKGLKCAITTNGTLLESKGDDIIAAGVYKVNISLHSFQDADEDAHRRYVNACADFADKASQMGVLCVFRLWNGGSDFNMNENTLKILKEKFQGPWVHGGRGARIRDKLHLEYADEFSWPDQSADFLGERVFCYGLRDHFGVLCDGSVIPCCLDHEGDMALGNVFKEDIETILCSPKACAIKDGFDKRVAAMDLCKRCGYARRFSRKNGI